LRIPFEPYLFGIKINIHLILEYLAFFCSYRYYKYLRSKEIDHIGDNNRLSIIIGAAAGAYLGSRVVGLLENPLLVMNEKSIIDILNSKTIMGGLFGGLMGVEIAKKIIGERNSSGDLFTFPIILGIFIGRIGCFLSGTKEFTYGIQTQFPLGMNLGDNVNRHPIALYELIYLLVLFIILQRVKNANFHLNKGTLFKLFMICYFGFRFIIEFIKPNTFFIAHLSSIQWLCLICWAYYYKIFTNPIRHAH